MTVRIAFNGLGRMGKLGVRAGWGRDGYEIVHINEIKGDAACHAHLLAFDSVHGRWDVETEADGDSIVIGGQRVGFSAEADPARVDWAGMGIDLVIDCTGKFKTEAALAPYFANGVKKVLVSAPVPEPALNIVYGVNHHLYDPARHDIVTAASCTTNCLAPVIKVLHEQVGIVHATMTTIHNITNTQTIIDKGHKDLRRARACGSSLIPTTTGSAKAITQIFPELTGKLNGLAVRVPLTNASLTDIVAELPRAVTAEEINALFREAAAGELKDILGYEERPLVSIDYVNDPRSAIVDAASTMVIDGTQLKVLAWYDNEWGYVNRMMDIARMMAGYMAD
ncbi:MAG: ArsJ-associated glyceraldehyde-3-phosphate dehydrogenase [Chromatiales bacterium]|nr:ArsJ-associated glyceraldehyde-3-phosphate dehydrogenase [Gammaproteobacteria bacterium]MCP5230767.1 ArsJ-associated glyceraldehyde-3-phosphate dehydrogenase [Zoogloeaceae bacterium]MCP5351937.1 ArsJ-associated glyceraldehyde-3-phosphate dehydrogenase [Chromatiales bacterium]